MSLAELDALAKFDKVFAISEDQFERFYRQLLGSRSKVHSAAHRFRLVAPPTDADFVSPARSSHDAQQGALEALVRIPDTAHADVAIVRDAIADVSARAPGRIQFTFVGPSARPPPEIAAMAGARWFDGAEHAACCERLRRADFVIFAGLDGAARSEVAESLAWRTPCLTHAALAVAPGPGVDVADFFNRSALAAAILKMADPQWLACLANEARAAKSRTWEDYAAQLASEMATDRPRDVVRSPVTPTQASDLYARMPNLRRRPKLSICISTYNRGGWIDLNLRNLFLQIGPPQADVEVLVVDNASTDSTQEVASRHVHRSDFRYVRNPRNVGMLGNLAVTAQRARGEFIWILGDDDFVRPGVIQKVLDVLAKHPTTELVYFNYGYTSERDPESVESLGKLLSDFNVLEPDGPDEFATVSRLAAKDENFYTAIYAFAARRDHAIRAYCQDTSGRIFSTMVSCIPTSHYILNYMPDSPAYWVGAASLVMNSNVSWAAYGALLDLEHLPAAWDLAERVGCPPAEVDRRRSNRLWLFEMMWREIFQNDAANNSPYFSAARALVRLKHLPELDRHIPELQGDLRSGAHCRAILQPPPPQPHCPPAFEFVETGTMESAPSR